MSHPGREDRAHSALHQENERLREQVRLLEMQLAAQGNAMVAASPRASMLPRNLALWHWDPSSPDIVWSHDVAAVLGLHGHTSAVTTEQLTSALIADDRPRLRESLTAMRERAVAPSLRLRCEPVDGESRLIELRGVPCRPHAVGPTGFVGVVSQLADQRATASRTKWASSALQLAQRLTHAGTWYWDLRTGVHEWSPELYRVFDLTPGAEPNLDILLGRVHADDYGTVQTMFRDAQHGHQQSIECRILLSDSSERHVRMEAHPIVEDGTLIAVLGAAVDVSPHRTLQEQLRQSKKLEALGTLAGGIAHDFNNLLTVILAGATLLDEETPTDITGDIILAAEQAAALTRQLLAFSRKAVLRPEVVLPEDAVRTVLHMLSRVIGERIRIHSDIGEDLHPIWVDSVQLHQVLINLAVNARDAMPYGGDLHVVCKNVVLDNRFASLHPGIAPGPHVMFLLRDNGAGIPDAVQSRVFEPFFTTKPAGKGTGLGLSTVLGVVKQSGGAVELESRVGEGTCVRLYLPKTMRPRAQSWPRAAKGVRPGHRPRVMVVEDDKRILDFTRDVLECNGYEVQTASTAEEARAQWTSELELLLTDVVLPEDSGIDLALDLRHRRPDLRLVFMTGHAIAEPPPLPDARYLLKPFSHTRLLVELSHALATP